MWGESIDENTCKETGEGVSDGKGGGNFADSREGKGEMRGEKRGNIGEGGTEGDIGCIGEGHESKVEGTS